MVVHNCNISIQGRLKQEDCCQFKTSLGYMTDPV